MRGQKTDNKTKAKVRASYALTNSYNKTAKELGISDKTVKKIIEEKEVYQSMQNKSKEILEDMIKIAINKACEKVDKEIETKMGAYGSGLGGLF